MSDTLVLVWLMVLGLSVFGAIPYLIWLVVSIRGKRWRRTGILIAAPLLFYLLLGWISLFNAQAGQAQYLRDLYDVEVDYGEPLFQFHSERAFNGDGYSLWVFELPDTVRSQFEDPGADFLQSFPKKPGYRSDWEAGHWREAPLQPEFESDLTFALQVIGDGEPGLSAYLDEIQQALASRGTFYALFRNKNADRLANIDLFIVDLERGRIYQINRNT